MENVEKQLSVTPRWLRHRSKLFIPQRASHYSYLFLGVIVTFLMYHLVGEFYPAQQAETTVYRLTETLFPDLPDVDLSDLPEAISTPQPPTTGGNKPPDYLHFTAPRPERIADTSDVFATYKDQELCHLSSLDLHIPFEPLCPDRASMLRAMSWGGRPGLDAPYIPYGCDMRFYTPEEIKEIMSRFSSVILMGDSIIRHLTNAFWMIMRGDIAFGGLRHWDMMKRISQGKLNTTDECACAGFYTNRECNSIGFRQRDWKLKPGEGPEAPDYRTLYGDNMTDFPLKLTYQLMLDYPLNPAYLKGLIGLMPETAPTKPVVFVMGHELWNDIDVNKTEYWMDEVLDHVASVRPSYAVDIPKLYVSTNAGGEGKPDRFLKTQSVQKMASFEKEIIPSVEARGIEFLGMYNMSVQATSTDGTHADLNTNLLKVMMVLNWLDKLDLSKWKHGDEGREEDGIVALDTLSEDVARMNAQQEDEEEQQAEEKEQEDVDGDADLSKITQD